MLFTLDVCNPPLPSFILMLNRILVIIAMVFLVFIFAEWYYGPLENEWVLEQRLRRMQRTDDPLVAPENIDMVIHLLDNHDRYDFQGKYTVESRWSILRADAIRAFARAGIEVRITSVSDSSLYVSNFTWFGRGLRWVDFSIMVSRDHLTPESLVSYAEKGLLHPNVVAKIPWTPHLYRYYPPEHRERALCIALCCKRVGGPLYAGGCLTEWGTRLIGHAIE